MTLAEMADHVCATARQNAAADVAQAKLYLKARYEMIWNGSLWKDAIWGYDIDYDLTAELANDLPFNNVFAIRRGCWLFPEQVGQVLAVRKSDQPLSIVNRFDLYRASLDEFEQEGEPVKWA